MKIGTGVLGWDREERQYDRYGAIHLGTEPYDEPPACEVEWDTEVVNGHVGKRVKMWAVVREARKSGHVGDLALRILPETPEVGERIDLGVGVLGIKEVEWDGRPCLTLRPEDGRETFWMDPHKLYRLHDQTVDLFIEETSEPAPPPPNIHPGEESCLGTGDGDGSLQVKGRTPKKVAPSIERLGDGMFIMGPPPQGLGERVEVMEYEDD